VRDITRVYVNLPEGIGYFNQVLLGIHDYVKPGKKWIIRRGELTHDLVPHVARWAPHGIISHAASGAKGADIRRLGVPAINVSSALRDSVIPHVGVDNIAAGSMAARHLLALGLRTFGLLGPGVMHSRLRAQGFEALLDAHGYVCHRIGEFASREALSDAAHREGVVMPRWLAFLPKPMGSSPLTNGVACVPLRRAILPACMCRMTSRS
jgi:LacI family transcriptional regulator